MQATHIRSLRKSRGLTLVEVSRVVGIDNGNLSRIERGIQLPDVRLAKRLAVFFKVSLDDIYAHVEAGELAAAASSERFM